MSLQSTVPAAWLLGLIFLVSPCTAFGQASDTARAAPDSQPGPDTLVRDTMAAGVPGQTADTALADSVPRQPGSDTARADTGAVADTGRQPQSRDTAKSQAKAITAPIDSVLRTSCRNPVGTGVAGDLLVVVFAPDAGAEERATAAESIGGKLLRQVPEDPGAYYLRVSAAGGEPQLRAAADQLIQMPQVRQVGTRACPSS